MSHVSSIIYYSLTILTDSLVNLESFFLQRNHREKLFIAICTFLTLYTSVIKLQIFEVLLKIKTFINFKHLCPPSVRMFIGARMPLLIIPSSFFFFKAESRALSHRQINTNAVSHRRRGELHTHMSFTGEEHDRVVNQIARRARPVRWAKVLPTLFRFSPRSPKKRVVRSVRTVHRCRCLPRGPPSVSLLHKEKEGTPVVLNLAARLI